MAELLQIFDQNDSADLRGAGQVVLLPGRGSTELIFDQETVVGNADEGMLIGNSRRGAPVVIAYLVLELLTILGGDSALAVTAGIYECGNEISQWGGLDWGLGAFPIREFLRSYLDCVTDSVTTALALASNPNSSSLDALRRLSSFLRFFEAARLVAALADISIDSLSRAADDLRVSAIYCGGQPTLADIWTRTWETDVMGRIQTVDGRFDGSSLGFFELLPETLLTVDLNDDCQRDTVVVSRENGGGSGIFYRLRVLLADRGRFNEVNVIPMGDRIEVESIRHDGGGVRLDLLVQAPGAGRPTRSCQLRLG